MARKRTSLDVLFTRKDEGKPAPENKNEQTEARAIEEHDPTSDTKAENAEPVLSAKEAVPEVEPEEEPEEEPEHALDETDPEAEQTGAPEAVKLEEEQAQDDVDKARHADAPDAVLKAQTQQRKKTPPAGRGEWEYRALQVFYDQVEVGGQARFQSGWP